MPISNQAKNMCLALGEEPKCINPTVVLMFKLSLSACSTLQLEGINHNLTDGKCCPNNFQKHRLEPLTKHPAPLSLIVQRKRLAANNAIHLAMG